MVINHNVSALNTLSYLKKNTKATQSSLEKLSSGKKINKAADDASGLAISQKMQAQINGLDQASQNVSDGTSLIQTAEGSLGKEQEILQKMRTLAVQAQNGTASNNGGADGLGDKGNIQDQVDELAAELDEISTQTSYNTMNVIDTSGVANSLFGNKGITLQIGYDAGQTLNVSLSGAAKIGTHTVTAVDAKGLGIGDHTHYRLTLKSGNTTIGTAIYVSSEDLSLANLKSYCENPANAGNVTWNSKGNYTIDDFWDKAVADPNGSPVASEDGTYYALELDDNTGHKMGTGKMFSAAGKDAFNLEDIKEFYSHHPSDFTIDLGHTIGEFGIYKFTGNPNGTAGSMAGSDYAVILEDAGGHEIGTTTFFSAFGNNFSTWAIQHYLQNYPAEAVWASKGSYGTSDLKSYGIDAQVEKGLDITQSSSIMTIQSAIDAVSKLRSKLGAYQNRLEYAGDNLNVESRNLTTAMSGITDTDMASEMMEYTKNNILVQSAEAMLAQANQLPQGVLSLIKS